MAKINKVKIRTWLWIFICIVLFFSGVVIGKTNFMYQNQIKTSQTPTKQSSLTFTIPEVPLPPNWSSKENLPGNSFDTALDLNTGIETQGTLNENNVIDYYSFTLKNPSQIILNISNVPKSLYWVLYNSQLNEIASSYRKGASQGSTQISLQNPGKYFIKVWADYHQFTNYPYTIRLNVLPFFE